MHPADFLNKWLAMLPAEKQAEFYAELTGLLTPPDKNISIESIVSEASGDRVIIARVGPYTWDMTLQEALQISRNFQDAAFRGHK